MIGVWQSFKWFKVLKNGPSKICGTQPLKNLKGFGLIYASFTVIF